MDVKEAGKNKEVRENKNYLETKLIMIWSSNINAKVKDMR